MKTLLYIFICAFSVSLLFSMLTTAAAMSFYFFAFVVSLAFSLLLYAWSFDD